MAEVRTKEQYDAAADLAEVEFKELIEQINTMDGRPSLEAIADWWLRWRDEAGHKRLGRILLKHGKATPVDQYQIESDTEG